MLTKTTKILKEKIQPKWYIVDASGKILGRLATVISGIIRGKNKPTFSPHQVQGDFVIVINASKIIVTGKKLRQKKYYHHSGYPGGLKEEGLRSLLERRPTEVVRRAVWGMLPKNRLRKEIIKKLKIFAGPDHPYTAQKPEKIKL